MAHDSSRPAPVTAAFVLFLLTVLLSVAGTVTTAIVLQSSRTAGSLGASPLLGLAFAVIVAVVQLLIVFRMRAGRNWARIVLLVLAVLTVLGTTVSIAGVGVSMGGTLGVLSTISVVVATVLMFVPASNRWFRAH